MTFEMDEDIAKIFKESTAVSGKLQKVLNLQNYDISLFLYSKQGHIFAPDEGVCEATAVEGPDQAGQGAGGAHEGGDGEEDPAARAAGGTVGGNPETEGPQ